ncbi:MAG: stage III sporulation protein AB [Schaedlerella sp.]|nr:stage III sporulation protein AB [Schaedlerella sp.]
MQRFIGSAMILAATTWAGVLYGKEQQSNLNHMYYLRHIINMLKGELEYSSAPLGEIFGRTAVRIKEPYRTWMHYLQRQTEKREEEEFQKIWRTGIEICLSQLHLKKGYIDQLIEIGDCIGKMDCLSESRNLELYLENLDHAIKKERIDLADKKRISSCIGVMSGLFLIIILN